MLVKCPALAEPRQSSVLHWSDYLSDKPDIYPVIAHHTLSGDDGLHVQLLLDPASCPMVISLVQELGRGILSHLLYLTRTWVYSHHLKRQRLLKLHNII